MNSQSGLDDYQRTVRALSDRLVEAQTPIRVLDAVKWDDSIRSEFLKHKGKQLPKVDRKPQRPGLMMAAIYRATLDEIRRDGAEKVLNQRLSLTPIRKLWLAWKTSAFG